MKKDKFITNIHVDLEDPDVPEERDIEELNKKFNKYGIVVKYKEYELCYSYSFYKLGDEE